MMTQKKSFEWIADPEEYEDVLFSETGTHGVMRNGKWTFIDSSGRMLFPPKFEEIQDFSENGLAPARLGAKWGFTDRGGNFTELPEIDAFYSISEDAASGEKILSGAKKGKAVYLNSDNKNIFKGFNDYDILQYLCRGIAMFRKKGFMEDIESPHFGIVKSPKKVIVPPEFKWVAYESGLITAAVDDNHYAVYDLDGKVILPLKRQYVFLVNENLIARLSPPSRSTGKYSLLDRNGKKRTKNTYNYIDYEYSDGLLIVTREGKTGALDEDLNEAVPCKFESVSRFLNGKAVASWKKKCGVIDRQGNWLIEPRFKSVGEFRNGFAAAEDRTGAFLINSKGEALTAVYSRIENRMDEEFALAFREGEKGIFLDIKGKEKSKAVYEATSELPGKKLVFLLKNDKWGAVDRQGKEVLPFIFDKTVYSGEVDYLSEYPYELGNTASVKYNGKFGILKF
ncbi:MAG TPA: WG repeat-containing protein [Leptospiraceae bacterium]|nr:WG repeat-containing protein [Leptospiraceae bacterium]